MLHGGEIYDKKIEYDFSVNLNPYPCPNEVKAALESAIGDIDKYPDITQAEFRKAVANAEKHLLKEAFGTDELITSEMIIGGNGASELLLSIVQMLRPHRIILPVPSFYGYRHALSALRNSSSEASGHRDVNEEIIVSSYLLKEENAFELTFGFADKISSDADLVILANPNNPTGRCIERDVFEVILNRCREVGAALIVDECFLHLSAAKVSATNYVNKYDRLFVVSAYTKLFSIPGVRLGFAISAKDNIENLRSFLPEWNLSVFAERAAIACADILIKTDFKEKSTKLIRNEKEKLIGILNESGIKTYESDANYILVYSEIDLYKLLINKGILIRDCSNFEGLTKGFYRIAIKDEIANDRFIEALKMGF